MFGISGLELIIIIAFVLLIFGPDKLPELARTFGKAWRQFKKVESDMERIIRAEVYAPGKGVASAVSDVSDAEVVAANADTASGKTAGDIWAASDEGDDEEEDEE